MLVPFPFESQKVPEKVMRTMRMMEKIRALCRSGHPEREVSAEKLSKPTEVKLVKGAKPGDKVVRLIRRMGSKTKKRRKGWSWHFP